MDKDKGEIMNVLEFKLFIGEKILETDKEKIDELGDRARKIFQIIREDLNVPDLELKPGVKLPGLIYDSYKLPPRALEAFEGFKTWCETVKETPAVEES